MPDIPVDRLPSFEMVTFSEPTGIPFDWDKQLLSKGVPKDPLGRYTAAHELTLLEVPDYGPLVCFTSTTLYHRICQDPHTGAIVAIAYMPPNTMNKVHPAFVVGRPSLVNSSLDQFIASVRAVSERFPFYSSDFLESEMNRAAEDLTEILRSIDRAAVADETTYWWTFVFDVRMGDFATEDVLGDLGQ